jgi:predicted transposase/invertase (TIGR01784 family)
MPLHLDEPVGIDPKVDVVFLTLFGVPEHEAILVSFLNAVLAPAARVVRARVLNPFTPARFQEQKTLVLDIRAQDQSGRIFQVEMQRRTDRGLDQRMLYGWARLYSDQLQRGDAYHELRPVVSVWVCEQDLFANAQKAHLRFALLEVDEGLVLHPDIRFDILQLSRWAGPERERSPSPLDGWFWFFNEGKEWREVPMPIDTPVMEQAMQVLNDFRTDVALSELYRGRVEYERIERGRQLELDETRAALAAETARAEAAFAELAALRAQLGDPKR